MAARSSICKPSQLRSAFWQLDEFGQSHALWHRSNPVHHGKTRPYHQLVPLELPWGERRAENHAEKTAFAHVPSYGA